jgi:hypothetical protein
MGRRLVGGREHTVLAPQTRRLAVDIGVNLPRSQDVALDAEAIPAGKRELAQFLRDHKADAIPPRRARFALSMHRVGVLQHRHLGFIRIQREKRWLQSGPELHLFGDVDGIQLNQPVDQAGNVIGRLGADGRNRQAGRDDQRQREISHEWFTAY